MSVSLLLLWGPWEYFWRFRARGHVATHWALGIVFRSMGLCWKETQKGPTKWRAPQSWEDNSPLENAWWIPWGLCQLLYLTICILRQFWRPETGNWCHPAELKVSAGLSFLGRLLSRICFLPLPFSCGCWHSLACDHTTPTLKASVLNFLCSIFNWSSALCVSVSDLPLVHYYKDTCDCI